jgi:tight adherence protein B
VVLTGALVGATVAFGVLLVGLGVRGTPPSTTPRRARITDLPLQQLAAASGSAFVALLVTRWPVAAAMAGLAAWFLPGALRRRRTKTDTVERIQAVATWTEMVRDTLAAAAGLEEALIASTRVAPEPIRDEVARLARRLEREPLVPALETFADEVANPAADLVVAALVTAARREARDLVPLLGALADSAQAEADLRLRVDASRARVRTASRIVTATLALFVGGMVLFNRTYLEPYGTVTGQLVLLVVGSIFVLGWWLLGRMARIDAPERFFGSPGMPSQGSAR